MGATGNQLIHTILHWQEQGGDFMFSLRCHSPQHRSVPPQAKVQGWARSRKQPYGRAEHYVSPILGSTEHPSPVLTSSTRIVYSYIDNTYMYSLYMGLTPNVMQPSYSQCITGLYSTHVCIIALLHDFVHTGMVPS